MKRFYWILPWLVFVLLIVAVVVTVATRAHGQFGGVQQPFWRELAPAATAEELASQGLYYRWVASDLANGVLITNWQDRVQGLIAKGPTGKVPTNSVNGIWIDTAHYLTNAPMSVASNLAIGLIINVVDESGAAEIHPGLWLNSVAIASDDNTVYGYLFNWSDSFKLILRRAASATGSIPTPENVTFDAVFSEVITNSTMAYYHYTNGVQAYYGAVSHGGLHWGGPVLTHKMPNEIGHFAARDSSPDMWLREAWVWTNAPPGVATSAPLSSIVLSNFHAYATNTYGYSP